MHEFIVGTKLIDEDRRVFIVTGATTRIVVIHTLDGKYVESVVPMFVRLKYKIVDCNNS